MCVLIQRQPTFWGRIRDEIRGIYGDEDDKTSPGPFSLRTYLE